jgi:hypothetical protein
MDSNQQSAISIQPRIFTAKDAKAAKVVQNRVKSVVLIAAVTGRVRLNAQVLTAECFEASCYH